MVTKEQLESINNTIHEYNKDITYELEDIQFINGEWQSDYLNNYADSGFIYYQQYLIVEQLPNDQLYIGIYVDTFSVNCDGDLIDTELEDYYTIDAEGECVDG